MLFLFRGRQVVFELFKCGNSNFCFFPHIFCYYVGAIFKAPRKILSAILSSISGNELINQLYVSLGSIKAGNTSTQLRRQVDSLFQVLLKHGIINEFEKQKMFRDYIAR
jgi:hypothetical protein